MAVASPLDGCQSYEIIVDGPALTLNGFSGIIKLILSGKPHANRQRMIPDPTNSHSGVR